MTARFPKPRFTIGGLFALVALVCAYLTTGLYADNVQAQAIAAILNPLLLLLAIIASFEPGRLGRIATSLQQQARGWFARRDERKRDR